MPESDDSYNEKVIAVQGYKKKSNELKDEWETLLNECNEDLTYVTKTELTKMKKLLNRFDKKHEKISTFCIDYHKNPKMYSKKIEKRLKHVAGIINELTDIRDKIRRRRHEVKEAHSTDDDSDLSSATTITYIESSSEDDADLMDFEKNRLSVTLYL